MSTKPTQTGRNSKQDWFECDANLSSKPEVMRIRRATRCDVALIVGRLVMLWSLVDQHGDLLDESERPDERPELDGIIPDYTVEDLVDQVGGDRAFWDAVISTGWLAESELGLLIPGFDRRFSTNSKRRSGASRRKMRQRLRERGVIADPSSDVKVQQELELETKSREAVTFVTQKRDNRTVQDSTEHTPPPTPSPRDPDAESGDTRSTEEEDFENPIRTDPGPGSGPVLIYTATRSDSRCRTQLATRAATQRSAAGVSPEVAALQARLRNNLGVTAPHVAAQALQAARREHLDAVLTWLESFTPIETPDGTLWPVDPGQVANRITQPGRAAMPPGQGVTFDPDWLQADRRRRDKQASLQRQTWDLVKAMRPDQLETRFAAALEQADQGLLRSQLLKMDAGAAMLSPRDQRIAMLRLLAMRELTDDSSHG